MNNPKRFRKRNLTSKNTTAHQFRQNFAANAHQENRVATFFTKLNSLTLYVVMDRSNGLALDGTLRTINTPMNGIDLALYSDIHAAANVTRNMNVLKDERMIFSSLKIKIR
jgi:hypothetical protein